ncbi:MAG: hypothetical protein V3V97_14495, partial [Hyphomicrobiaceae bacterium]
SVNDAETLRRVPQGDGILAVAVVANLDVRYNIFLAKPAQELAAIHQLFPHRWGNKARMKSQEHNGCIIGRR